MNTVITCHSLDKIHQQIYRQDLVLRPVIAERSAHAALHPPQPPSR